MKEFYEDFVKLQAELPSVLKNAKGQAGQGKFKYADLPEIVETIRPLLAKYGFAFMQPLKTVCGKTVIMTIIMHKSGNVWQEEIEMDYMGEDIKKFGAAITYYRRYCLQSILGIVADADADDDKDTIAKGAPVNSVSESTKIGEFCFEMSDKYNSNIVTEFLRARANYNKRSMSDNIDDFKGRREAFEKEIDMWVNQRAKKTSEGKE